ncbi:patatin-like phospholipase family protein [Capnocytophaga catalasegens]|uniref:PNPLA domain-containing protein n=1 Tax=Capnocytophaga catalasegens TaxID=1004260 RepID=A0AAV5AW23_9FLAO|nr:patatin-like phospholipase family protein [Capnocytophaga catalasegens]GIZ14537.1 hypothetical protein RCZ03_05380 [Capnocytophaga catalasegens]GJM50739.1 hypothetical protein RCZ15_17120 [Capnocytophaga catalasegens]GJM51892.1 hypothetical protein RCZ16_02100 [Capnocytophaga catalasegens]
MKKIGLTLSGGGVRSLAHIGFIEILLENNIIPSIVTGTSGGALVGALYACGYSPKKMLEFFQKTPIFKFSLVTMKKPGVIDSNKYISFFSKYFPQTFSELKYPLTITATDLITGKLHYFDSGELIRPLIASAAFPPYFSPIHIGEGIYTDGGILNNFPIEPIENQCNILLGSFVSPLQTISAKDINSTFKLLQRIYNVGMDASYYDKFRQCHFVFLPEGVDKTGTLDKSMIEKTYTLGYQFAQKQLPILLEKLNKL